MTKEEAIMVENYYESGYMIKIDANGYVDSEVHCIMPNESGELCYDSEVFSEMPLSQVHISSVSILKPIFEVSTSDRPTTEGEPGYYEIRKVDGEDV